MNLNSDQKEIMELFVKQELLIARLYQLFAERYPEYRDFWTEMVNEEHQHASCIQNLTERDPTDQVRFSQGELRSTYLDASIKSIKVLISGFKNDKDFPFVQAVNLALQLEKALWEKKVFQYFETDSDEVRRVMDSLNRKQEIHIKKIDKFAQQFQGKSSQS